MSYFGEYLRSARGGLSLSQAAALIGCTKAHLWQLESARADNPGIKLLDGMSRAYAIPLAALAEAWLGDEAAGPESLGVPQEDQDLFSSLQASRVREKRLVEALEPFARAASIKRSYAANLTPEQIAHSQADDSMCGAIFTNGQVRRAAQALQPEPTRSDEITGDSSS